MTRSKRFLAGAFLAAAIAAGTASPALANMHATGGTPTTGVQVTVDSSDLQVASDSTDNMHAT
ncbi:hypothetical protein ABTY59_17505 [Streptomyces sp. NPDC096079]|uniref:hypothetical protein n=1 Tax=Streptomyces sp. NPDC096079 TaxID=3155820 RepID=UPI003327A512